MIRIRTREHNGINFTMFESTFKDGHAEAAMKIGKCVTKGLPSITKAYNQYKYGDEIIAQCYSSEDIVLRERVNENYNRIQVFYPKDLFIEMAISLLKSEGYSIERQR